MKCIKDKKTGAIVRVSNTEAHTKTQTKEWAFVPKSAWRKYTGKKG